VRTLAILGSLFLSVPLFAAEPELTVKKSKESLDFSFGGELVTKYVIAPDAAKPYFWPLNAPGGIPVTRAWPMVKGAAGETTDHVHQKSAWFCHGDVIPVGLELKTKSADKHVQGVDFWSETAGHGKMVCIEVGEPKAISKTELRVPTKNEWRTADGDTILTENRTITVRKLDNGYLIVLDVDLLAHACPITFGDTKEGSLGVRVPDRTRLANKDGGTITSSDGKTAVAGEKDNLPLWGIAADWHDYTGKVGDKTAGIAIFDDPKNAHRSVWHTRAYGLMAANPFGRDGSKFPGVKGKTELVTIPKGEHLKLRYGIFTHTGDAKVGEVAKAFGTFSGEK
jgi:hypothetical protein